MALAALAAGWHPDPSNRAAYRYWDGTTWTAWASDGGTAFLDVDWDTAVGTPGPRCPRCRTPLAGRHSCPSCGLGQDEPGIEELRTVSDELEEVSDRMATLGREHQRLMAERRRLLAGLAAPVTPPVATRPAEVRRPARGPAWEEWRPERVRDVLLWLGAALLAIAAAIFAVVAWSRLGQGGRAGLLAAATLVATVGAIAARRRLPATAEALGALALALVLIDWLALRRAGVATGHAAVVWWAWGTALDAGLAAVSGRWLRAGRILTPLSAAASGTLAVAAVTASPWAVGLGLAALAGAGAMAACWLWRLPAWRAAAAIAGTLSAGADLAAAAVLLRAAPIHVVGDAAGPAVALATVAVAPVAFRSMLAGLARATGDALVGVAATAVMGSTVVWLAAPFSGARLVAAASMVFAGSVIVSGVAPAVARRGLATAGGLGVAGSTLGLIGAPAVALFGPWSWTSDAWSVTGAVKALTHLGPHATSLVDGNPAAVALAAVALAAGAAGLRLRHPPLLKAGVAITVVVAAALAEAALLPVLAGLGIGGVTAVQLGVGVLALGAAVVADRAGQREAVWLALAGAVAVVPALGWSLASRGTTLAALAAIAAATGLSTWLCRRTSLRQGLGGVALAATLAEVGAAMVASGSSRAAAGLAVALAGAAALEAAVWWRRDAPEGWVLETVALAALAAAPLVAFREPAWRAGALTVAVPAVALAGIRVGRRAYLWADVVLAVLTTWAWLAAAHVSVLEAYTLPAAAAALGAGAAGRHADAKLGSWLAYGAGLVVAFGPTLQVVLDRGGLARPLLLTAGAVVAVVAGARGRLRAPLTLGALTLLALAVDTLGPVAARLPRWATIGAAGLLLLWLGATAERRLSELRHLRERYEQFG